MLARRRGGACRRRGGADVRGGCAAGAPACAVAHAHGRGMLGGMGRRHDLSYYCRIAASRPAMRTATELLAQYAAYHRDRRNIVSHFVGVPMIVFSIGVLLARPALA